MKETQSQVESRVVHGAHGVSAEEDHIVVSKVVLVGVGSILIFIVAGFWAWRILVSSVEEYQPEGPGSVPVAVGQYEIGIVNQRLLELDAHAQNKIADQHAALANGWGETPGQKVHPTVSEAIDRVIAEQARAAPPPSPAPAPTPSAPKK